MMEWLYSNPEAEQMNLEEVSVENMNLVQKKKKVWNIGTGELKATQGK